MPSAITASPISGKPFDVFNATTPDSYHLFYSTLLF